METRDHIRIPKRKSDGYHGGMDHMFDPRPYHQCRNEPVLFSFGGWNYRPSVRDDMYCEHFAVHDDGKQAFQFCHLACMGGAMKERLFRIVIASRGSENNIVRLHSLAAFAELNGIDIVDEQSYERLCVLATLQDVLVDDY